MTYYNYTCSPRVSSSLFAPAVNLYSREEGLLLQAELPGFKKEDVTVEVTDGVLEISASGGQPDPEGYTALHKERRLGDIKRSFKLGENLNEEKVEARFEDGLLSVSIARKEAALPRSIKVL